jgi:magnesium transporter
MQENQKTNCQLYDYDSESYVLTKNTVDFYAEYFADQQKQNNKTHWLNFHSIDEKEQIEKLCKKLEIEVSTFDDIYKDFKRPKLEEYNNYLFFKIKSALPKQNSYEFQQENISFIVGAKYLISFQERSSDHFTDVRDRIEKKRGKIRLKGTDFLLFRLLEAIIDNYFEALDDIVASIESLESKIIIHPHSDTLKKIEIQKRKLIELRKIVFPMREITFQLEKMHSPFLKKENHYFFVELKDNCLTILDEIDANKQILDGMANLYYAVQGQRMNEIMRLLTIVSSIFIPLTFLVGVYGMNFKFMPELQMKYGYYITWGIMLFIASSLLFYFRKLGWLKRPNFRNKI